MGLFKKYKKNPRTMNGWLSCLIIKNVIKIKGDTQIGTTGIKLAKIE